MSPPLIQLPLLFRSPLKQPTGQNYYLHGPTHDDESSDSLLFRLDHSDTLLENPRLQQALVSIDDLLIENEIGQGVLKLMAIFYGLFFACHCAGAFGCVFKGIFTIRSDDGQQNTLSVAVKTIRSKI